MVVVQERFLMAVIQERFLMAVIQERCFMAVVQERCLMAVIQEICLMAVVQGRCFMAVPIPGQKDFSGVQTYSDGLGYDIGQRYRFSTNIGRRMCVSNGMIPSRRVDKQIGYVFRCEIIHVF